MHETSRLAEFLAALRCQDLPVRTVSAAKQALLDGLAAALYAIDRPWSVLARSHAMAEGGRPAATVWGSAAGATERQASLANSVATHGIELDDRLSRAQAHPGCVVIPVALACGENRGASGPDVIASIVAGYELGGRVGEAVHFPPAGLHAPSHKSVWFGVAAAAAASGLDARATAGAYGVAGSLAAGISEFALDPGHDLVKRFQCGFGAANGVLAAQLATAGVTGPRTVLEGRYGYCTAFGASAAPDGRDLDALTAGLGRRFQIDRRETKAYAAWGGCHAAIDAVGALQERHDLRPGDIATVVAGGAERMIAGHEHRRPTTITSAQYSTVFVLAVALCRGAGALADPRELWRETILDDPAILQLASAITLVRDPALDARARATRGDGGAWVEVTTTAGVRDRAGVADALGSIARPVDAGGIARKFRRAARGVLTPDRAGEVIGLVDRLEHLDDIRPLCAALSVPDAAADAAEGVA